MKSCAFVRFLTRYSRIAPPSHIRSRSTTHSASSVCAIEVKDATEASMSSSFNPGASPSVNNVVVYIRLLLQVILIIGVLSAGSNNTSTVVVLDLTTLVTANECLQQIVLDIGTVEKENHQKTRLYIFLHIIIVLARGWIDGN